jgi:hypothetical protein
VPLSPLLSARQERSILEVLFRKLVYPHGVSTLNSEDTQFRPRHLSGGRYHFDEAYHNGDIWLWLTGPLITALLKHNHIETAMALTDVLTDHILDLGAAGTLSELFNAVPTAENDNEAGTYSQAWSLAEYIRVIYQDYLGIRPNALEDKVILEPIVPSGWGAVSFQFSVGQSVIEADYGRHGDVRLFRFRRGKGGKPLRLLLRLRLPGSILMTLERTLSSGGDEEIRVIPDGAGWRAAARGRTLATDLQRTSYRQKKRPLRFRPLPAVEALSESDAEEDNSLF